LWARFTVDSGQDSAKLGQVLTTGSGENWSTGAAWETSWGGAWNKVGDFDVGTSEGSGGLNSSGV